MQAPRALPAVFSERGSDVLLVVAMMALAAVLMVDLPTAFNVDSWLALVTGRDLWQHGLPHHETLTLVARGAPWIDQQWLSQLASYGLYLVGGLGLLGVVNVALLVLGVGGAVVAARRLGAHPKAVLAALPLLTMVIGTSREVRTQEFAIPLFVAVVYLLSADSRKSSRRVYWCLPILVLWANLHGTATLGAGLVGLRALSIAWERRHSLLSSARAWVRPLTLAVGAPVAILLTPYGTSIIGYYRTTMLGGTLRQAVSEWQPITSSPIVAAFFFVAAAIAIWSFGRNSKRTTTWEKLALLVLAIGSISVVRNVLFFGLFALMIMPLSLAIGGRDGAEPADRRRARINVLVSAVAGASVVIAAAVTLFGPSSRIEFNYQRQGVLTAVEKATSADPSLNVLAEDRFSDWLLWRDPALDGRVANDVRYEILTPRQVTRLERVFSVLGTHWKAGARGYRLLVLDRHYDPQAVEAFLSEPGRKVLYDDGERFVILRSAKEAG